MILRFFELPVRLQDPFEGKLRDVSERYGFGAITRDLLAKCIGQLPLLFVPSLSTSGNIGPRGALTKLEQPGLPLAVAPN
jgi:hypothetical protein